MEMSKYNTRHTASVNTSRTNVCCAEAVLAMLLTSFSFELPEQKIVWNMSGIVYPSVDKPSAKAEMPLKVSKLKSA